MSERTKALLERFQQTNSEIIASVERCSAEEWSKVTASESWPVGLAAHHVAESVGRAVERIGAMAEGRPFAFPPGLETSDARNALHAERYANCTKEETLAALRESGSAAETMLSSFGDEQLGRVDDSGTQPRTVEAWIETLFINHPRNHLKSIQETL